MDEFTLKIKLDPDSRSQPNDVARALRKVAGRIEQHSTFELIPQPASILDQRKRSVGFWSVTRSD